MCSSDLARPVFLRSGGTIPIVNHFQEWLGIPTVLMGFALPDDRIHAPNEKFHLPNFYRGITTSLCFLAMIGNSTRSGSGLVEVSPSRSRSSYRTTPRPQEVIVC